MARNPGKRRSFTMIKGGQEDARGVIIWPKQILFLKILARRQSFRRAFGASINLSSHRLEIAV